MQPPSIHNEGVSFPIRTIVKITGMWKTLSSCDSCVSLLCGCTSPCSYWNAIYYSAMVSECRSLWIWIITLVCSASCPVFSLLAFLFLWFCFVQFGEYVAHTMYSKNVWQRLSSFLMNHLVEVNVWIYFYFWINIFSKPCLKCANGSMLIAWRL